MGAKTVALITAGVVGACVAGAFATVALTEWPLHRPAHEEYQFETGAEAKEARTSFPTWVPDTASSITYAMKPSSGEQLVKATLKDGKLPPACKPVKNKNAPAPKLEATWFPKETTGKDVARCDLYYAYTDGITLYSWQNTDKHGTSTEEKASTN